MASIAWIEPALRVRTTIVGSPANSSGPRTISGASGPLVARTADVERAPARRGGDRRDGDGSQPMDEAVEEEQEEEDVGGHQDAGHA